MVVEFLKVANVSNSFAVNLPPSVVFSVLELFQRRLEGQTRTMGLLLGTWTDDGMHVNIEECFPIPIVDLLNSESDGSSDDSSSQSLEVRLYRIRALFITFECFFNPLT
jgi:hypothetical protein